MPCVDLCTSCKKSLNGGSDGTCGNVIAGQDPGNACMMMSEGRCSGSAPSCACVNKDPTCGGPGCPKCAAAKKCTANADCGNNLCKQGVCCSTDCAGPCNSCDLGIFWAGTCTIQFIGAQGGCPANQACDNSNPQKCVAGVAIGAPCGGNSDCVSGLCIGGLCIVRQQNFGWPCRDQNDCDNGGCQPNHFCG